MPTNTKEIGLEDLIVQHLTSQNGYELGIANEYIRSSALDEGRLFRFLETTQGNKLSQYGILENEKKREQLAARIQGEIEKRGTIDVLRKGVDFYPAGNIDLYYFQPSEKNPAAKENYEKNIFSVTRQLMYAQTGSNEALDFCIFINGLPLITAELKNQFTHQNYENAIEQYKKDRNPRELLFHFGRCIVHFAIDDSEIHMCTKLEGKNSWFLPFNKGYKDGAGNPPNPAGLKTDYLWNHTLTKNELSEIIENYAQILEEKDPDTGKTKRKQIFPRYHQLSVVRALLTDAKENGVGKRYLIQHSAGSGKSNSIAWLALQIVSLEKNGKALFDSVIVITDRVNLDNQIKGTIKGFTQMSNTIGHAESSEDLRKLLTNGKNIIISTIHKFPYILDSIKDDHKGQNFAIIIDEAHSSQSGRMAGSMNVVLNSSPEYENEKESIEDIINNIVEKRKMLKNASYFAFTATPKNKTLETFGAPYEEDGKIKHRPFHEYTMKQAIQEGFILDVLQNYTPVKSYFKLIKKVENDPEFDKRKALKKLKALVERDIYPISQKAEIIVEHFHTQVISPGKIHGKARCMVVCRDIDAAIKYYNTISKALENRKSQYKAIIAFSGEKEIAGETFTESSINKFPSSQIEKKFKEEPYRFLVVANKFQTGYDEPLLHTMYVDKPLSDIKAVQTLSRLNRAYPGKYDTFVLDFFNDSDIIKQAFDRYYKTTILSDETDVNKLYDLIRDIEDAEVFTTFDVEKVVTDYLSGVERNKFDPTLDSCAANYEHNLDLDGQIKFKSSVKTYLRTYGFLASILPIGNPDWERLSIFLNYLLPKLTSPDDDDLAKGILSAVDLESYRAEALTTINIILEDEDAEINPIPTKDPKGKVEPEMDFLSRILEEFQNLWGNIKWNDKDRIMRDLKEIPGRVAKDEAYQNAIKNSDRENARLESERALKKVIDSMIEDNLELYKLYVDNLSFKKELESMVFNATYDKGYSKA